MVDIGDMDPDNWNKIKDFMLWKRDNPQDYKDFVRGLKEFVKDIQDLINEE